MGNLMQSYIFRQPEALQAILDHAADNLEPFIEKYHQAPMRRIVLAGAGSSFHALNMARPFCREMMHMPVFACTPAQFDWQDQSISRDTLVVVASQSGTSTNTLAMVRKLREAGFTVAAITQYPSSPVARAADCHVLLDIPEEKTGPKTMGVTGTILTMQILAAELAYRKGLVPDADLSSFYTNIRAMIGNMSGNITATVQWCADLAEVFLKSGFFCAVGQGDHSAIAGESALKLIETVRKPAMSYELEEIIHGPAWVFGLESSLLYLGAPWEEATRPAALCDLCEFKGGKSYRIFLDGDGPRINGSALALKDTGDQNLCAYALLLPAQVMSAYLPPQMNIDLDLKSSNPYASILAGHL